LDRRDVLGMKEAKGNSMKMLAFSVTALLLASPAFSQLPPGTGYTPGDVLAQNGGLLDGNGNVRTDGDLNDGQHRICRRVATSSGSRMSTRRLCLTPEGWRNYQRTH
jgi:hypothetical protein